MDLKLADFLYDLPEEQIAQHPPKVRGKSKLLQYQGGHISHRSFEEIPELIPAEALLVFNDTRVIPARIILYKETGARIELFLLEPHSPSKIHEEIMGTTSTCTWKCMIGNAKKWPVGAHLVRSTPSITAERIDADKVCFSWDDGVTFAEKLQQIGQIPLPPYIGRSVEKEDAERYQTVYSKAEGAVAAPTAGLHFTEKILKRLHARNIQSDYITLHVSSGTFKPIKSQNIAEHPMHNEQIVISKENIEQLLSANKTIAVGTTSMRTLESLYWYGVKLINGETPFFINKTDPYHYPPVGKNQALEAVLNQMEDSGLNHLAGQTEIFIYPGYPFQICDGLVTNYHLPGSTLMLLVAAFIGEDWRRVYQEAMTKNYRFLSYGDSSLLWRGE